jgi:hypothetical protein
LSRLVVVVELKDTFALGRGVDLQDFAKLGVVDETRLVLVRGLEALVGLFDTLGLEIILAGEFLELGLFVVAGLYNACARGRRWGPCAALGGKRTASVFCAQSSGGLFAPCDHGVELLPGHLTVAVAVYHSNHLVDLFVRHLLSDVNEDVSYLGSAHKVVLVKVESLERL